MAGEVGEVGGSMCQGSRVVRDISLEVQRVVGNTFYEVPGVVDEPFLLFTKVVGETVCQVSEVVWKVLGKAASCTSGKHLRRRASARR